MKIIYFGIEDCELEIRSGNPTIIAPEGIDEERLTEYDFIQLVDGRWCHYMDELETAYYVNHENTEVLSFPPPPSFSLVDIKEPDNSKANLLTGLFVIIFLTGIAAIFFELYELSVICIMRVCQMLFKFRTCNMYLMYMAYSQNENCALASPHISRIKNRQKAICLF